MRLSKKGEYAVRAIIEICQQSEVNDNRLLQISAIAESTNIPEKFLEQILLSLKNGGILKSKRGVDGGYSLNKVTGQITVGEIVRLLDGPLSPLPCVSKTAYEPCSCPDEKTCGLRLAMGQVRDSIANILDNLTLSSVLADIKKKKSELNTSMQFDI
jgi:Rrf2 family transcriptional regulator, cysteine metabolism repressor